MKFEKLAIPEVILLKPQVYSDNRGFFFESYNHSNFEEIIGQKINFVQDNHSLSYKGVLRGLHYQLNPRAQGKLVRVIKGEVFDIAVDIRRKSPTFGKWISALLSAENNEQLWIPPGFAHGFLCLSDSCEFLYKTTDYYSPASERCIIWSDESLAINWPSKNKFIISDKDKVGLKLDEADLFL